MIYLKNSTEKQECFIPKNGAYVGKKTYKEGVEYQKSLIEPITITDNGVYENENGYSPVDVNIPFGSTTITENGIYDARNGYVAKSDEEIGYYWRMQGGGFLFQLDSAYNSVKMQVLFKPSNEVGEYFPDLIRGIIGSYAQNFYIAEEVENPYKIFACVGDWQSEHIEITNDWHLLSLSKTEFTIDGKVVGIVPEGIDVAVTTIFLNGLYDTNTNNYFYPNLGEYSDVKIWCDDDLRFDCVYFYEGNQSGEYGYLNKVDNQLVVNTWKVVNNWLTIGHTSDYKLKNVRALDYIEVQVLGDDVNLINKDVVLENEVIVNLKANEEGVDGFREVNIDATPLKNKVYQYGYEDGLMNCPDCESLTELYVNENGVYEGAFNRVDVNVADVNGSYDEGYIQGYKDGQENCEGEGGGETSCTLEHLTITENGWYEPKAQEFDYLVVNENSAFDTGVKLVENSTIEIYFNTGSNWDNIPTLIGCENTDWSENTFAARWYNEALEVKIGTSSVYIQLGVEDESFNFHKLKFGRYEGVWFDDNYIGSLEDGEWTLIQNTIYIGAMNNTTNGDANGVWRPWNGYLGNVKIYGEKNGEVRDYYFNCGDFGRWGEYETEGNILPNLMGDGGATLRCCKQYGTPPFDGYRSVDVNVDVEPYKEEGRQEILNNLKTINITENGNYNIHELQNVKYLNFGQDNNVFYSTGKNITKNSEIEVAFMVSNENHDTQTIIGTNYGFEAEFAGGGLHIIIDGKNTWNVGYNTAPFAVNYVKINKDGFSCNENRLNWDANDLYENLWNNLTENVELLVGTTNMTDGDYKNFKNSILWVKIDGVIFNANENLNFVADDGSTFVKGGGGEPTFNYADVNKYDGSGWSEINVNVEIPKFDGIALKIETNDFSKVEVNYKPSLVNTSGKEAPNIILYDNMDAYVWSYRDVTKGVAELRQNAFNSYSNFKKVKLSTIMTLGERAFKNAYNLEEIEFSNLLGRIGAECFDGCNSLSKIICRASSVVLGSSIFEGLPENGILYLVEGEDENKWLSKLPNGWVVERL